MIPWIGCFLSTNSTSLCLIGFTLAASIVVVSEGPIGIGFTGTNDFYFLDRLRVNVAIQPKEWLLFYGEVQDARIFLQSPHPQCQPIRGQVDPLAGLFSSRAVPRQVG